MFCASAEVPIDSSKGLNYLSSHESWIHEVNIHLCSLPSATSTVWDTSNESECLLVWLNYNLCDCINLNRINGIDWADRSDPPSGINSIYRI